MTPTIITYLIGIVTFGYLSVTIFLYKKNKKNGQGNSIPIFTILAALIVFCLCIYALITGQTYDDLMNLINDWI